MVQSTVIPNLIRDLMIQQENYVQILKQVQDDDFVVKK